MGKTAKTFWAKMISWFWNRLHGLGLRETRAPVAFIFVFIFGVFVLSDLYMFMLVDNIPPGMILPVNFNTTTEHCYIYYLCRFSAKTLFLGHSDFYIHTTVSYYLVKWLSLATIFSANFISGTHVLIAMISSKFIAHESLNVRRFGFVVYEFRNLLDAMDGLLAREAQHMRKEAYEAYLKLNRGLETTAVPPANTGDSLLGYVIDGVCDALGSGFLMAACIICLQRRARMRRKNNNVPYSPLNVVTAIVRTECGCGSSCEECVESMRSMRKKDILDSDTEDSSESDEDICPYQPELAFSSYLRYFCGKMLNATKSFINIFVRWLMRIVKTIYDGIVGGAGRPAFLISGQLILSSFFWNRNINLYTDLLEHPNNILYSTASNAIHSPILWLICFAWRVINPLSLTEVILCAIFVDRSADLFKFFQYSGYVVLIFVAAITEIYRIDLIVIAKAAGNGN